MLQSGNAYTSDSCNGTNLSDPPNPTFANNQYYVRDEILFACGTHNYTFSEWLALGMDTGSGVHPEPKRETIIEWARAVLAEDDGRVHMRVGRK